jgi:hypothetical protein
MPDDQAELALAGPILAGLRELYAERARVTQTPYLTDGELSQIDRVLAALGYEDSYGRAREWTDSLRRCLFGWT